MRRASSLIPLCSGRLGILLVLFISLHNSEWFTSTRSFSSVLGTDLSESEEARTEPIERSPSVSNDPPAPSTGYLSTLTSYFPSWWNSRVEAPGSSTTDGATIPLSASSSEVSPLPVCPLNQNLLILETMEQEPNGPSSVMWKRIVANAEEKPDNDTTPRVHVELQASMVEGEVVDEQNTDVSVSIELGTHSSATLQGDIPCQIQSVVGETLDPSLSPMNEETAFRELSRYVIEMEATVDAHPSSTCHLTEVVLSILGGVRDEQTLLESRLLSSSTALNSGFLGENNTNAIHSTRTQSYRMKKEVPVPFGAARRLRISLAFSSKETPTNDTEPTADPTAQRCGIAHFGVYLLRRERRDGHDLIPRLLEEVAMDTADVINLLKPVSGSTVLPSGEHMNILRDNHWNMASDVALGNGAPIQFRVIPSFHSPPGSVDASHLAVYFGTVETGKNEQFSASEVESASYADQISIVRTFPIPFRWEELTAHRQGYISFSGYVYMDVPAPPCVIPDANLTATLFFTNQDGSPCEQHAFEFQALDFHHQASDPTKRSVSAPDAEITDAFRTFHTTIRIPSDATQLHVALAVRGKDAVSGRTRVCFREINALVDRIAWVKDPAEKARQDATEPATDTPQQSNPELMDGKEGEGSSSARGESTLQAKENHATVDSNPAEGKRTAKRKTPPTETRASPSRPRRDPHPSSSTVPFYRKGVFKWVLSVVSFGVVLIALTLGVLWGRRTRGNSSIRFFLPSYDRTKGRKPQYRVFRERKQNRPTTQSECTRKLCSEDHVVEEAIDGANPSDDDSAAEMYHEHDMYGEYDMVSEELSVTPVGSWVSSAPASYSERGLHICTPPLIMTRPGQGEGHITTYGKGSSEHGTLEQSGTGSFRERVAVAATTLVTAMRVPRVDPNRRALLGGSHSTTTDYAPDVETLVRDNKLQRDSCLDEMHQNYFTASSLLERTEEN